MSDTTLSKAETAVLNRIHRAGLVADLEEVRYQLRKKDQLELSLEEFDAIMTSLVDMGLITLTVSARFTPAGVKESIRLHRQSED